MIRKIWSYIVVKWGWCKHCGTQTNWIEGEHGYICERCGRCPNEQ